MKGRVLTVHQVKKKHIICCSLVISLFFNFFLVTTLLSKQRTIDKYLKYSYCTGTQFYREIIVNNLKKDLLDNPEVKLNDKTHISSALISFHRYTTSLNTYFKRMKDLNPNFDMNLNSLDTFLFDTYIRVDKNGYITEEDLKTLNRIANTRLHGGIISFYKGSPLHHYKEPQDYYINAHTKLNNICEEAIKKEPKKD